MAETIKKNFYELLNVPVGASADEIERAYRRVRELYRKESVAVYSLFSSRERNQLFDAIESAYEVLSDPDKRRLYDEELRRKAEEADRGASELNVAQLVDGGKEDEAPPAVYRLKAEFSKEMSVKGKLRADYNEPYRILFTRLLNLRTADPFKVFLVTSAVKGEGKTMISVNLALVIAEEFKKRVLLLEGDMRNPSFDKYFRWPKGTPGLADVIKGKVRIEEAIMRIDDTNLHVLHASLSTNPFRIINSNELKRLVWDLRSDFDYILIDAPPVIPLADVSVLSRVADGLLFVVRADKTPRDLVVKAVKSANEASILGIVLNGADISFRDYYYY